MSSFFEGKTRSFAKMKLRRDWHLVVISDFKSNNEDVEFQRMIADFLVGE